MRSRGLVNPLAMTRNKIFVKLTNVFKNVSIEPVTDRSSFIANSFLNSLLKQKRLLLIEVDFLCYKRSLFDALIEIVYHFHY